jgi:TPP-dependent pyruvate/acetoin dehydrogenase alpha subunit
MAAGQVREALRWMLMSRCLDDLCTKLQRLGRIGLYGPVHGQEASVVGSAMALDPEVDWMVPASREQPAMLRHGLPLASLFASYMGRPEHASIPPDVRLLPRQQSIGAQLPQAAGLAWSMMLRREPGVVLVYCGEGASSEGDFHEACNLAGVLGAPLVIVLINNRYAISTPVSKQTAAHQLSARAAGYGFPGTTVDGNDLFAVFAATRGAVARAKAGQGPSLIECETYRVGFHNTSDNPAEYRDQDEVDKAVALDPIDRVRRYAAAEGIWSATEVDAEVEALRRELDEVQRGVAELPRPGPGFLFDHVYADPPLRMLAQRASLVERRET